MNVKSIDVVISGQSYRLAVAFGDEGPLLQAVKVVDAEMSRIRATTSAKGQERVAVMAAIRLAADLLTLKHTQGAPSEIQVATQLASWVERIDHVLRDHEHIIDVP